MKAVVFHGVGDIRLDDVKEPKIEEQTDAVVRLTASAICGTDLHFVRGTVTPITAAYVQSGQTCRDFLASYVNGSSQSWLQGEACKQKNLKGAWEVRSLKPWKRS